MTGARGEKRGINRRTSSVREFKEPEFDHAPASLVIGFSQPGFSILWATQQLRFSSKVKDIGEKKVECVCIVDHMLPLHVEASVNIYKIYIK